MKKNYNDFNFFYKLFIYKLNDYFYINIYKNYNYIFTY